MPLAIPSYTICDACGASFPYAHNDAGTAPQFCSDACEDKGATDNQPVASPRCPCGAELHGYASHLCSTCESKAIREEQTTTCPTCNDTHRVAAAGGFGLTHQCTDCR